MLSAQDARTVAVVGAGTIGPGIAVAYLLGGLEVHLVDVVPEQLTRARHLIDDALGFLANQHRLSPSEADEARGRLTASTDLSAATRRSDFVQECVPEDPTVKRRLFHDLERTTRADICLGTNASTLRLADIVADLDRPERVVGVHWVQPPYIVPVVEIVRNDDTAVEAVAFAQQLMRRMGKAPITVRDIPGFVVNRLKFVLLAEACSIVEQGAATIEDVDTAARFGIGLRYPFWGVFGTHDRGSNKRTSLANSRHMARMTGETKFGPSRLLEEKVAQGALGIWAGRGWYDYGDRTAASLIRDRDEKVLALLRMLEQGGDPDAQASPSQP